ncbi:MAG: D-Ala-D-Ala carboxypeptidase family metallohydrolase [Gloeomargaritales cyanobacterium]|jgi:zinc D-Ala-D-Ala carboxypeptidase
MELSKNLTLAEMTRSESAKRLGINNNATKEHIENMKLLASNIFQPIRDHFKKPIHISSGYRSKALNDSIKGSSKTSQHSSGEAIDIDMDNTDITNAQVFDYIKNNLNFDQLIWEFGTDKNPSWVHVSYESTGKQRKQILKAIKKNGKTSYINY